MDKSLLQHDAGSEPLVFGQAHRLVVGWGERDRLEVSGSHRFEAAAQWSAHHLAPTEVAFASFSFSPDEPSVVVLPQRVERQVTLAPSVLPPILHYVEAGLSRTQWEEAVTEALLHIEQGNLAKVVLARSRIVQAATPFRAGALAATLTRTYPQCWTYSVDGLVGATPELLLGVGNGVVHSRVLAGSQPSTDDPERLLTSRKDQQEHAYAVASVREALRPWCARLEVPTQPELLRLPHLHHLASDIRGQLRPGVSILHALAAVHPSAAVGGTPRQAALELIAQHELTPRGRYAGPIGWFDGAGNGMFGLALRGAQIDPANPRLLRLHAGCGIVAGSDPAAEWAETATKFQAMRAILGPVHPGQHRQELQRLTPAMRHRPAASGNFLSHPQRGRR